MKNLKILKKLLLLKKTKHIRQNINNQNLNLEARIIYLLQRKNTDINKLVQEVKSLTDKLSKNDYEKIQLDEKLQECVTNETVLKDIINKQNDERRSLEQMLQQCQHTVTQTYEQECSKLYYIQFYNDLENIFQTDFKMITDDANLTEESKYRNILQSLQEKINDKEISIQDLNSEIFRLNENKNKDNKIIQDLKEKQTKLKDQMQEKICEYDTKIRRVEDRVNKICKNLKQMIGEEEEKEESRDMKMEHDSTTTSEDEILLFLQNKIKNKDNTIDDLNSRITLLLQGN